MITFPLTEADLLERAQQLAQVCDAIHALEEERKDVNDAFKQRHRALTLEERRLSLCIQSGKELRNPAEQQELPMGMPPDPSETFPPIHDNDGQPALDLREELSHKAADAKPKKKRTAR